MDPTTSPVAAPTDHPTYHLDRRCRPHGRNPCPDFYCGLAAREARTAALQPVTERPPATR